MSKPNPKSTLAKAKALEAKMSKELKKKKARVNLQKESPQAYHEMIREKGYRQMEKDTGKPVQRFRSKSGSAALHRLNDSAKKAFARRELGE